MEMGPPCTVIHSFRRPSCCGKDHRRDLTLVWCEVSVNPLSWWHCVRKSASPLGLLGPQQFLSLGDSVTRGAELKTETTVGLWRHHSQMFWFSLLPVSTFDVFIARKVYLGQSERKKDLVTDWPCPSLNLLPHQCLLRSHCVILTDL